MADRFDYSPAHWNRLSRSVRRLDDDTVEIKVSDHSIVKLGVIFIILQLLGVMISYLYDLSGERVVPNRPPSFSTMQEMFEERYLLITDFETWLIPARERNLQIRENRIIANAHDPFYEPDPIEPYEEFYASYAKIHGETMIARLWRTIRAWNLGLFIFILLIFVAYRLFLPACAPIRLDARRRAVYGRSWYGLVLKRFFGLTDLRPNKSGKVPNTLEALKFRTEYDPEYAAYWQNRRQTRVHRIFYPFKLPAMIHLSDLGCGPYQRFTLGAYPQRKNQPEELGRFIEDYFDHPTPGEWTKNLRYRWPIWGDLRGWIINFNLFPCPPYNEGRTLGKLKKSLAFLDSLHK